MKEMLKIVGWVTFACMVFIVIYFNTGDFNYDDFVEGVIGDSIVYTVEMGEHKKYGLMHADGTSILEPVYDYIEHDTGYYDVPGEFYLTRKDNQYGLIDKNGKFIINNEYDFIYNRSDDYSNKGLIARKDNQYYIFDTEGNIKFSPLEKGIEIDFYTDELIVIIKDDRYAIVDYNNNFIVNYLDEGIEIERITEGVVIMKDSNQYGIINLDNNLYIAPSFDYISGYTEGLSVARKIGSYGFINKNGEIVIDFQYENAEGFSEGLACVKKNNYYGYIDVEGNIVLEFKYTHASRFQKGFARVYENGNGEKYINRQGQTITPIYTPYPNSNLERIDYFSGDLRVYYTDNSGKLYYSDPNENQDYGLKIVSIQGEQKSKYGLYDTYGKQILDVKYEQLIIVNSNFICTNLGCLNREGAKLFDFSFTEARRLGDQFIKFETEFYNHIVNEKGEKLFTFLNKFTYFYLTESNNYIIVGEKDKVISINTLTKERKVILSK